MYKVLDSCGGVLRTFPTWSEADKFRQLANRLDWRIEND